ncbi:hypothetical protein F66182_11221 [Fusarium sp. NRRL 66182]|nr:hypothetical protein F66182_11221 [Fusarium sp. NRRL 66182]
MGERPTFYIHFEMGVSLPKVLSKDRHITYTSKSMRDRANQFPRHLPSANTNYLSAPAPYPVAYQHMPTHTQPPQTRPQHQLAYRACNLSPNTYSRDHVSLGIAQEPRYQPYRPQPSPNYIEEYYAPAVTVRSQQGRVQAEEVRRSSRSLSRSSYERGRSAPPPLNSSPWDATLNYDSRGEPQLWKALPASPNQFRLGENDMPWDTWSFPMGFNDNTEDSEHNEGGECRTRSSEASLRATWGPEIPGESSRAIHPVQVDDRAQGKEKDIQSLASALMTVDNGFEDQWWYQGPRLVNLHGTVLVPTAVPKSSFHPEHQQSSVGWAVSLEEQERQKKEQQQQQKCHHRQLSLQEQQLKSFVHSGASFQPVSPRSSMADIVSPLSDYSSPQSTFGGLRRSLTTRSDELYIS